MMTRSLLGAAFALVLPVCAVEHNDTYQRTFPLGSGQRSLIVENINGIVRVAGDSGNDVRITVREHLSADTAELLATARNEVKVEMRQEGNTVRLYLDGPFKDRRERRGDSYRFRHDFELQVPRDIDVTLRTVNSREGIQVSNVRGTFEVKNVNGKIEMKDVAGHGSVESVNGPVTVTFVQNPRQASTFKTLNGTVDVAFQPDLSGEFKLSSMNGDAWTDFEYEPMATAVETQKSAGSSGFRYKISDRNKRIRIGSGGIEHTFSTLNGQIKIRKYGK
jgi:hypothetical protein